MTDLKTQVRDKWAQYETEKKKIIRLNLSDAEYEKAIRELLERIRL